MNDDAFFDEVIKLANKYSKEDEEMVINTLAKIMVRIGTRAGADGLSLLRRLTVQIDAYSEKYEEPEFNENIPAELRDN